MEQKQGQNQEINPDVHTDYPDGHLKENTEDIKEVVEDHAAEDKEGSEFPENGPEVSYADKKEKNETWEWIKALTIAVLIALGIRTFLFAPIVVDGTSMVPTLQDKERLIVNKAIYNISEPKRGDILVFHAEYERDWIKRVIGEPGDIIEVRNDELYVNGELIEEQYLEESKALASGRLTEDFKAEVPEGHIFVMGDNRQNSRDSRSIGPIPIDSVVGRADVVFWPFSEIQFVD